MRIYKTQNIDSKEISLSSAWELCDDQSAKNWIYKGSLLNYLKVIPENFEALVPIRYYSKNKLTRKQIKGEKLFESSFSTESASEVINRVTDALAAINLKASFDDLKHYIILVSSELVRNGIILNLKKEQKEPISLTIHEAEEDILINVVDPYGELECPQITRRLKLIANHGDYERKEYGAGLGLFMVIKSVDSIEFKVKASLKTEIICSISKYKRLKHFKEKETTLFFEREE